MQNKEPEEPLLIAGQFPPPVHGFSYITQQMAALLSEQYDTTIVDLVPHSGKRGLLYHMRRSILAIKGALSISSYASKNEGAPVYIACESKLGLIYTILLSAMARRFKCPTYLHYHNFTFIDKHSALMSFLLKVAGKEAVHIFLCPLMGERFAARYGREIKSIVISNSAFVDHVETPVRLNREGDVLTLGLVSNLNEDKGLSTFIETIELALKEDLPVKGILAGPPASEVDRVRIKNAQKSLGDKLEYRGPVYGKTKDKFFKDVDVFLFPTQYVNEAQPTVIAEAQSYGIPVLSFERGCICDQVGSCGAVFKQEQNFQESAVTWLKEKADDMSALNDLKAASREAFLRDKVEAFDIAQNCFRLEPKIIKPEPTI